MSIVSRSGWTAVQGAGARETVVEWLLVLFDQTAAAHRKRLQLRNSIRLDHANPSTLRYSRYSASCSLERLLLLLGTCFVHNSGPVSWLRIIRDPEAGAVEAVASLLVRALSRSLAQSIEHHEQEGILVHFILISDEWRHSSTSASIGC